MNKDLINRESLLQVFDNIPTINGLGIEPVIALRDVKEIIKAVPEVDAVPLDKLCEWLAGNAWHLDCSDCDGGQCDCPQLYDDSGSSPEFWKAKLTTWMEAKDASPQ